MIIESIGLIIVGFLSILGSVELIRIIERRFVFNDYSKDLCVISIIPIKGHQELTEYLLKDLLSETKWNRIAKGNCQSAIIIADCGMDYETLKICRMIAQEYPFIRICNQSEIIDLIDLKLI